MRPPRPRPPACWTWRKWRDVCLTGACRRGRLRAVIGATLHASNNNNTNCEGRMSTPLITVISAVERESWQSAAAFVLLWRDNQLIMIKLTEKLNTVGYPLGVFCRMILFLFWSHFPVEVFLKNQFYFHFFKWYEQFIFTNSGSSTNLSQTLIHWEKLHSFQ